MRDYSVKTENPGTCLPKQKNPGTKVQILHCWSSLSLRNPRRRCSSPIQNSQRRCPPSICLKQSSAIDVHRPEPPAVDQETHHPSSLRSTDTGRLSKSPHDGNSSYISLRRRRQRTYIAIETSYAADLPLSSLKTEEKPPIGDL